MGSVKGNLIAARALIDTPEKWASVGSIIEAMARSESAESAGRDFRYMRSALYAALPRRVSAMQSLYEFGRERTHADIMALFDRAIASQEKGAGA